MSSVSWQWFGSCAYCGEQPAVGKVISGDQEYLACPNCLDGVINQYEDQGRYHDDPGPDGPRYDTDPMKFEVPCPECHLDRADMHSTHLTPEARSKVWERAFNCKACHGTGRVPRERLAVKRDA